VAVYRSIIRFALPVICLMLVLARNATPAVQASVNSMFFTYASGGSAPAKTVTITNPESSIFIFDGFSMGGVNFTATPNSCNTPCTITVSARQGLAPATYQDTLTVTLPDPSRPGFAGIVVLNIPITLTVAGTSTTGALITDLPALQFNTLGGSSRMVNIGSLGPPVSFRVQSDVTWLTATPVSSTTPQTITVVVNPGVMPSGVYTGHLTITDTAGVSSPLIITATLNLGTVTPRALAHIAEGNGFKTTVLLTNVDTAPASYVLRFNDNSGNVPASPVPLEAGALTGVIPPGRSVTIRTSGQSVQALDGWAELTAPVTVGGSVIYSQRLPTQLTVQEGTTAIEPGSTHFFVPFDNTNGAVTGLALTNPGATPANIAVTLRYDTGTSETVTLPSFAARTHQAYPIPNRFSNTAGQSGVAEFTSGVPISAVAFRFNSSGAFTALGTVR
jgi:hypothetical protein